MIDNKKIQGNVLCSVVATLLANLGFWVFVTIFECINDDGITLILGVGALVWHVGTYFFCERRYIGENKKIYHLIFYPVGLVITIPMGMLAMFVQDAIAPKSGFLEGIQYFLYGYILFGIYAVIAFVRIMIFLWKKTLYDEHRNIKIVCAVLFLCGVGYVAQIAAVNMWERGTEDSTTSYEYVKEDEDADEESVSEEPWVEEKKVKRSSKKEEEREVVDPDGPFDEQECKQLREMTKQFTYELELDTSREDEWPGIVWEKEEGEYHVAELDFSYLEGVKGKMNFSDFEYLQCINLSGTSVTELTIPKATTKIELEKCEKLKKIVFCKGVTELSYLDMPEDYWNWEDSVEKIVFLGDAPLVNLEDGSEFFSRETPIYHTKKSKGWEDEEWEEYNLKILG